MSWELFVKNKLNEGVWDNISPDQLAGGRGQPAPHAATPAAPPVASLGTDKSPKDGDFAYTKYNGIDYIGKLQNITNSNGSFWGKLIPTNGGRPIFVGGGRGGPISWDNTQKMWSAPADED